MTNKFRKQPSRIDWRKLTHNGIDGQIEVAVGSVVFIVQRIHDNTYLIERLDGLMFDGKIEGKIALGMRELKKFLIHSANYDR